jgi:23S rRNA (guanine745-N1)-methyltransferase
MSPANPELCLMPLICPVCEGQLSNVDKTLRCPEAHSFDISREGYVNLLPAGRKQPRLLGDTPDMLRSRRTFLEQGHYNPLSDALNKHIYEYLVNHPDLRLSTYLTDVGCGEGYYLGRLKQYLDSCLNQADICYFGFDISKEATKLAARKYKGVTFAVADTNRKILLSSHSTQVLLNIFAPRNPLEFHRILTHDGLLLVVIPGANHLIELQLELALLEIQKNKQQFLVEQFNGMFKLKEEQPLEYKIELNGGELVDLIKMTPNYWHISKESWPDLKGLDRVQTTVSFIILKFCR